MIPEFPHFKKLSIDDKAEIEKLLREHLPFSDFTFVSLYSWNIDENTQISVLNNNLVVEMKDYSSDDTILSFIGNNKVKETISLLLEYSDTKGNDKLTLVPESVVSSQKDLPIDHIIAEDRDQFDYVYAVEDLVKMPGSRYHKKRNLVNKFEKNYLKDIITKTIDLKDSNTHGHIRDLVVQWQNRKKSQSKKIDEGELLALEKSLKLAEQHEFTGVVVYHKNNLVAFTIGEIMHNDYSMIHFEKTNQDYYGISEYVLKKTAEAYGQKGAKWLNYQQDLGVTGLRTAKELWKPSHYLKKYIIKKK